MVVLVMVLVSRLVFGRCFGHCACLEMIRIALLDQILK